MLKKKLSDILNYTPGRKNSNTIKSYYIEWRSKQNPPIPLRCDNPSCYFYLNELIWNGKILPLILDHINGVNGDNNPSNLRFLCPNCNQQQETTGGRNRNKVEQEIDSYTLKNDGKKEITQFYNNKLEIGSWIDAEVIKSK